MRTLYESEGYVILLLDYIDGKLIRDQAYNELDLLETGRSLLDAISQIEGELPCYCDISTSELWQEYVSQTLQVSRELIKAGTFTSVTSAEIDHIEEWAFSRPVTEVFQEKVAIAHGDARGENILITETGYKIIDWQRPLKAPAEIDLVALLESQNIVSSDYVNPAAVGIFYFTRIAWAVECQVKWIPEADCYDAWVKGFIQKIMNAHPKLSHELQKGS